LFEDVNILKEEQMWTLKINLGLQYDERKIYTTLYYDTTICYCSHHCCYCYWPRIHSHFLTKF